MSFWSKIGDAFKSVGKGIVGMIPGMAINTASNAMGGAMSAKDAKRQHQYDLEKNGHATRLQHRKPKARTTIQQRNVVLAFGFRCCNRVAWPFFL